MHSELRTFIKLVKIVWENSGSLKGNFNDDKWWYFYEKKLRNSQNFLVHLLLLRKRMHWLIPELANSKSYMKTFEPKSNWDCFKDWSRAKNVRTTFSLKMTKDNLWRKKMLIKINLIFILLIVFKRTYKEDNLY